MDLLALFEHTLRTCALVEPGQRVLVAFSGGADSTALLHLFCTIREEWSLGVNVAHLNHALRGEHSDADEAHCRQVCANWHVAFFSRRVEVLQEAEGRRISVEMAAREVRYAFLQEVAEAIGADAIALGHTRDDQIETVLLNLTRGTGSAGLGGMPTRKGRIIRPLLEVSRQQIRQYCAQHGLAFVEDISNLDPRYSRNRIRHHVLPQLRQLNPRVDSAVERLAMVVRDEEKWWQEYLRSLEPGFTLSRREDEWRVSLEWLKQQPDAIQRRVIRHTARELSTDGTELEFAQVERLREAIRHGKRAGITLHGGNLHIAVGQNALRVWLKPETFPAAYEIVVNVPGETPVPTVGILLVAEYSTLPKGAQWRQDNWEVWCDAFCIVGNLVVRSWRHGDRIQPLGMRGHRKISDIFIDRKVPVHLRRQVPVVCDEEGIVWVVGICVAERVRCTPETERAVHLRAQPRMGW